MHALINQTKIFYADTGGSKSPPVIFIHAFPMSHKMWQGQVDFLQGHFHAIATIKTLGTHAFVDGFLKAIFLPESIERNRDFVVATKETILTNHPTGICAALLAMGMRTDTTEALRAIAVPTLVVVGEKDTLTPIAMAQNLHERIRHSRLAIIPEAAHMSNLENPGEFNRHLLEFLENLRI